MALGVTFRTAGSFFCALCCTACRLLHLAGDAIPKPGPVKVQTGEVAELSGRFTRIRAIGNTHITACIEGDLRRTIPERDHTLRGIFFVFDTGPIKFNFIALNIQRCVRILGKHQ
jgi:hypothetical protein